MNFKFKEKFLFTFAMSSFLTGCNLIPNKENDIEPASEVNLKSATIWGVARARLCAQTLTPHNSDLYVTVRSAIEGRTLDRRTRQHAFLIPAGRTDMFCASDINGYLGEIRGDEGHVTFSYTLKDKDMNILDTYTTTSYFDGSWITNSWDINEWIGTEPKCGTDGFGIYLETPDNYPGCGKQKADDDETVLINYRIGRDFTPESNKFSFILTPDPQSFRSETTEPVDEDNKPWRDAVNKGVESINRYIQTNPHDFGIANGDITEYGRPRSWRATLSTLASINLPFYLGLGNHDYANSIGDCWDIGTGGGADGCAANSVNNMEYFIMKYSETLLNFSSDWVDEGLYNGTGSLAYSWDYKGVHFVQLQNYPTYTATIGDGSIGVDYRIKNSLDWLEDDLKKAEQRNVQDIIINMHDADDHVVKDSSPTDLARLQSIMDTYKPIAILAGHEHYFQFFKNGVGPFTGTPVFLTDALYHSQFSSATYDNGALTVKNIGASGAEKGSNTVHSRLPACHFWDPSLRGNPGDIYKYINIYAMNRTDYFKLQSSSYGNFPSNGTSGNNWEFLGSSPSCRGTLNAHTNNK